MRKKVKKKATKKGSSRSSKSRSSRSRLRYSPSSSKSQEEMVTIIIQTGTFNDVVVESLDIERGTRAKDLRKEIAIQRNMRSSELSFNYCGHSLKDNYVLQNLDELIVVESRQRSRKSFLRGPVFHKGERVASRCACDKCQAWHYATVLDVNPSSKREMYKLVYDHNGRINRVGHGQIRKIKPGERVDCDMSHFLVKNNYVLDDQAVNNLTTVQRREQQKMRLKYEHIIRSARNCPISHNGLIIQTVISLLVGISITTPLTFRTHHLGCNSKHCMNEGKFMFEGECQFNSQGIGKLKIKSAHAAMAGYEGSTFPMFILNQHPDGHIRGVWKTCKEKHDSPLNCFNSFLLVKIPAERPYAYTAIFKPGVDLLRVWSEKEALKKSGAVFIGETYRAKPIPIERAIYVGDTPRGMPIPIERISRSSSTTSIRVIGD